MVTVKVPATIKCTRDGESTSYVIVAGRIAAHTSVAICLAQDVCSSTKNTLGRPWPITRCALALETLEPTAVCKATCAIVYVAEPLVQNLANFVFLHKPTVVICALSYSWIKKVLKYFRGLITVFQHLLGVLARF